MSEESTAPYEEPAVLYGVADHVATITLNRPDRLNAITGPMLDELSARFLEADHDSEVRCVILTGAGRGFCSGLDLIEAAQGEGIGGSLTGAKTHINTRNLPTLILFEMDTPVICALNGAAAGYGLDLALGADIRIAADTAKIVPAFARRGVVPESGGTWYLPRLVGWAKAAELGFLGRTLVGREAKEFGLVNEVVAPEELLDTATEWALEIAANAPLAVAAMKRMFRHGLTEDFASHTHHVLLQVVSLFQTEDFAEGVAAYVEKREPKFEGR